MFTTQEWHLLTGAFLVSFFIVFTITIQAIDRKRKRKRKIQRLAIDEEQWLKHLKETKDAHKKTTP